MHKSGSCLCGAVRFEITGVPDNAGACHCSMCRKWSGGVFLAIQAGADALTFTGTTAPAVYPSSDWAERGFCPTCGSSLFYRVTAPGPHHGDYHIGIGSLDDASGIALTAEIFIDEKPAAYSFADKTDKMTGPEVMALFAEIE